MTKSTTTRISKQAGDTIDEAIDSLKEATKRLGEEAGDAVSAATLSLAHAAVELAEQVNAQSQAVAKRAGGEIRKHPAATAAVAAAAVALVGVAIAAKKSADN